MLSAVALDILATVDESFNSSIDDMENYRREYQ